MNQKNMNKTELIAHIAARAGLSQTGPVELAPSIRPGAMDAYALPSLRMGRRVWPRGARGEEEQK